MDYVPLVWALGCEGFQARIGRIECAQSIVRRTQPLAPAMNPTIDRVLPDIEQGRLPTRIQPVAVTPHRAVSRGRGEIDASRGIERREERRKDAAHLRAVDLIEELAVCSLGNRIVAAECLADCDRARHRQRGAGKCGGDPVPLEIIAYRGEADHIVVTTVKKGVRLRPGARADRRDHHRAGVAEERAEEISRRRTIDVRWSDPSLLRINPT